MLKCTAVMLLNQWHYSIQMEKVSDTSTVDLWKNNTCI